MRQKNKVHSLRIKTYLILLLVSFIPYLTVSGSAKDKNKKKVQTTANLEPDRMVAMTRKGTDLPSQKPAHLPNAVNYSIREGIDVSHYQGTIDWNQVAQAGDVGYVFIKASEGSSLQDDKYSYNVSEARRAGVLVGSYHFFRANASLDDQFSNFTSVAKREQQDLVPIVDVEHTNGVSTSELVDRLHQFMERLTKYYGQKPILYTFVNFYNRYLSGQGFDHYPLMIAFYRDAQPELYDGRKYVIWQYSSRGRKDGIRGRVDLSRLMDGFSVSDLLIDQ
jgi:lysozyme